MTNYTLGWEIKDKPEDTTTLSAGTVALTVSDAFIFGVRAAFATLKFGDIAFRLKDYYNDTVLLQFILAQSDLAGVEITNLSGDQLLEVYLNEFVVAEDEFANKFNYPNIPPNVAFMVPKRDDYNPSELNALQDKSVMCKYAIVLGNDKSEEGYTLIAIPDTFDVNEFLSGFCFIHKQFAVANAKRESHAAGELVRAADIPADLLTPISLVEFDSPTQLSTVYRYNPDGTIEGLNIVSKERINYV